MRTPLDRDGQPLNSSFNSERRLDRAVHELLGLAKGVLADGEVSEAEAIAVMQWVQANPDVAREWPVSALAGRLHRIFEDFRIDEEERQDLARLLRKLVGGDYGIMAGRNLSTELPLDDPMPPLRFEGQIFVFTGAFAYGPRGACEEAVRQLGGICHPRVTMSTNVLVLGTFASRDWAHTSYGRKIEKAVEYRARGLPLAIVSEDHWAAALP